MTDEDGAARAGPDRPDTENNIAERIKMEREVRDWSTAKLAERMAEVGHPVNQSAIWRIESGKPRRRVNLDEAMGFCKVFDLTLDDLTSPPGHIANAHVRKLVAEYVDLWKQWVVHGDAMDRVQEQLKEYTSVHPDQEDLVKALLAHEVTVASEGRFHRHHRPYGTMRRKMRSWLGDALDQPPTE